ncbi:MAG: phenylalanine--tRNA ligase subunit beta [Spirochaetota bacterium]
MKISYNWLAEFVKIDDIDPFEIGHKLTMCTSEIEGVEEVGGELERVVVGRIVEVNPHPNSDHLYLTKTDVGGGVLDIISGAPNTRENTLVPVALIGAELPGGMKVKKTRLRGVYSMGVVCSEKELGVSDDHSGLWILDHEYVSDDQLKVGTPVKNIFPTRDYIIEIDNKSITHRPDLWGHYGFARELSAILGRELAPVYPDREFERVIHASGKDKIQLEIEDPRLCPRYTAIMMDGIHIKKSPYHLRRRLFTLGIRPINNIVDITNYVMMETGQPLHAFDASRISEQRIIVRRARRGESLCTLDGVERKLGEEHLLITDPENAVAVAGVMGGQNSEIDETSDRIIIESANFNPVSIRRTAVGLGLRTEASNRFEKSLDPHLTITGLTGCVSLIGRYLPESQVISPLADLDYSEKKKTVIALNTEWVSRLIGMKIPEERIKRILTSLQFGVEKLEHGSLQVEVPSFRATKDISIEQDLVEEVGRIYGYDNITPVLPMVSTAPPCRDDLLDLQRKVKLFLSWGLSFSEVYTYSFQEDAVLDRFYSPRSRFVHLENPVSSTMSRLRKSLVPGLFGFVENNFSYRNEFAIFETGSVYPPGRDGALPAEKQTAAVLILEKEEAASVFFTAKGKLERLFEEMGLDEAEFVPLEKAGDYPRCIDLENLGSLQAYHPGRRAVIAMKECCFGVVAELNPRLLKEVGIDFSTYRAVVFEVELELMKDLVLESTWKKRYRKLPRFPQVVLALACVVDEDVPVKEVRSFISSQKSELIEHVELFDIYRGKPLDPGKKSLAFNIHYRKPDRTLTEKEAMQVHEDIARKIKQHGWELR